MMTDDLRKLAEAATPGPWEAVLEDDPRGQPVVYYPGIVAWLECSPERHVTVVARADGKRVADAAFIAAANPAAILALLDDRDRLVELLARADDSLMLDSWRTRLATSNAIRAALKEAGK